MSAPATDHPTVDTAAALRWLVEMGADEVVLDQAVNRMLAVEPVEAPAAVTPKPETPRFVPKPAAAIPVLLAEGADSQMQAEAMAASCDSTDALIAALGAFDVHPLKKTATRLCFLGGAAQARVLLLSDRPRNEEDKSGDVLAGKHQVLAERMLMAIGLCGLDVAEHREQVMLANFIPWRPPGNRSPTEQEALLCLPFLRQLLAIAQPDVILSFGALAGQYLAGGDEAITRARGKWLTVNAGGRDMPLIATFHPETLLKSPQSKRLAWQDLQAFRARLDTP